eukprot:5239158-Prymnesium_polylepis.1
MCGVPWRGCRATSRVVHELPVCCGLWPMVRREVVSSATRALRCTLARGRRLLFTESTRVCSRCPTVRRLHPRNADSGPTF